MLQFLRFMPVLPLALGFLCAQEASNIFEKAPPDVDEALRGRITGFYQAFVDGKFRRADAFVAEDSKDVFFSMEKRRYKACDVGTVTYSDNFTKAKAVTSCDTNYFMMGREVPIKLPIMSEWVLQDGQWFWYVVPIGERIEMNTPIGSFKVPPHALPGEQPPAAEPPAAPPARPDPAIVLQGLKTAVKVDRESMDINPTKASTAEIHVTNALPGNITLTADAGGVDGLSVKPAKVEVAAQGAATLVVAFDPDDPSIRCRECLSHPQSRRAGQVNLRVDQTGQQFQIEIHYITPAPEK